mmetsp:Transcript_4926/g.7375  ORF Transcript_4926/g.7375 Transcript_4926/m.7375 type:complete len:83 (-) Transcript_4926:186-434(-)
MNNSINNFESFVFFVVSVLFEFQEQDTHKIQKVLEYNPYFILENIKWTVVFENFLSKITYAQFFGLAILCIVYLLIFCVYSF